MGTMINLKTLSLPELTCWLTAELGQPAFRAQQIYQWIWQKGVTDFEAMTNLSKEMRQQLREKAKIESLQLVTSQQARDGTIKALFALPDGQAVETVLMVYNYGTSVCVSSQVGCRMGCRLCASTLGGLVRNLEAWEIYDQVLAMQKLSGSRVGRVVVMGTGEPLDNYDEVVKFLRLVSDRQGLNIGQRHLTVSTSGLVPRIYDLAREGLAITLAISLHAPNDQLRSYLLPINRKYPLQKLLAACDFYTEQTGRRITYEYALIKGVNDSEKLARQLGSLLRGRLAHVNLIPINPVPEYDWERPEQQEIARFRRIVETYGLEVSVRRELGQEIDAACGQLRRRVMAERSGKG
ncbi:MULTISPECIES: 23S rRNA (adenine(2503)-C(2))-methyltransferase RlmN [unclassified Carboxydocella]|uniref:23S rRNA (adenine(2503)-C(2))-methyltransferase RlmN n=1 Tax=unclassified Carboxydocella TaxID=2685367 RepID=UPI0035E2A399